jgi:hypothetical protein
MAIKHGKTFRVNPSIWLHIESKNDLLKMLEEKEAFYSDDSLADFMKRGLIESTDALLRWESMR